MNTPISLAPLDAARAVLDPVDERGPLDVLRAAHARFGERLAIACSFGAEDMVLVHLAAEVAKETGVQPRVFTLDTGRLPESTHHLLARVRERYGLDVEVLFPDAARVAALVRNKGPLSFLDSIDDRRDCCHARKVEPLRRHLADLDMWVTGLRRAQAPTRADVPLVEEDAANGGLLKLNPLYGWSEADVWRFVDEHAVPVHALHARGYPSIGCAPCTRAVPGWSRATPDDPLIDIRAGRWWWESPDAKECGLHPADDTDDTNDTGSD